MTRKNVLLAWLTLALAGCDPIRKVSVTRTVAASLAESCVVQELQAAKQIQSAGVSDNGVVYAVLLVPDHLDVPESNPAVTIQETTNSAGERELVFSMTWVGARGSPEYLRYVETTMRDLQEVVIDRCES